MFYGVILLAFYLQIIWETSLHPSTATGLMALVMP